MDRRASRARLPRPDGADRMDEHPNYQRQVIANPEGPDDFHEAVYCRPHDCQIFWSNARVNSGDPVKMP